MTTINDGGPAFPGPDQTECTVDIHEGMTLRDYFAAKADVSIYGPVEVLANKLGRSPTMKELAECVAQLRLLEADAMLAARAGQSAVRAAELLALVQDLLKVFVHDPFDSQPLVDSVVARAEESVARAQLGVYA
ncbi:hypothetical protein [Bordetella bronchiseptica]|uniref:hypothetical protein n=1 Tax=Bordetella bronchiseptica TaxID=518 RepID=UPI00045B57B2|nr:hypothetical protein [Bordetella bronchiseptica]KAK54034.1 hypothetical protein L576_2325 [Bordetella bronchiseptica OSU054]